MRRSTLWRAIVLVLGLLVSDRTAAAAAQDLLPGEMPVEFGREMVHPRQFPTIKELIAQLENPETSSALVFQFYGDKHNHYAPQWSPDGRALASLRSDVEAHTSKIVILPSLDSEKPLVLYPGADSYDHMFAWSSSGGRAFAFASTNESSEQENIHLASLASRPKPSRVTSGPGIKSNPSLWMDGSIGQLFFSAAGKVEGVRVSLEDPMAEKLEPSLGEGSEANWSPDGQWVAWTERIQLNNAQSSYSLKLHHINRQNDIRLFAQPGMLIRNPTWSPDGRHIAFYGRPVQQTGWRLFVLPNPYGASGQEESTGTEPVGGGTPSKLNAIAQDVRVEEHFQNFGPSWDPRGDRLWFFGQADDQEYYPLRWSSIDGKRRGQVSYPRKLTTGLDVAVNPNRALRAIAFCAIEDLRQDVIVMILNHKPE